MRSEAHTDFDAFAASVREIDCDMMLRNPRQRLWRTWGVEFAGIDVQMGLLGSGNIAQGALRPDGCMLYVPLTDGIEYKINGDAFSTDQSVLMEPGSEFCFSTTAAHDWSAVFIPTKLWTAAGGEYSSTPANCRVTSANRGDVDQLRALIREIFAAASQTDDAFESSTAAATAGETLIKRMASVTGAPHDRATRSGRPKLPRQEVIRRALQYLDGAANTSVSIGELAEAVGVSERTLRSAFREYYGIGPGRFLQLRKLHAIHRTLKKADPEQFTVSQVLMHHGEWAFSRVAARYRQLFGELPSETLQRRTR